MPKKGGSKEAAEPRILLGRPTNNVKMGIVGLPNVGKSTFFNTLCKMNVAAENYPFCTIDPTESRVTVPDSRFDWLVKAYKPKSEIQAVLTVTDIAGLVKGASAGAGLGNEFLSNIASVDGIFHMCRGFPGEKVTHVEGSVDPCRDLSIIMRELILKDIASCKKWLQARRRNVCRGSASKEDKAEFIIMEKVYRFLRDPEFAKTMMLAPAGGAAGGGGKKGVVVPAAPAAGLAKIADKGLEDEEEEVPEDAELGAQVRFGRWSAAEVEVLNKALLLTSKPAMFLCNLSEKQYISQKAKCLLDIKKWIDANCPGEKLVPFSAKFEAKVHALTEEDPKKAAAFIKESGAKSMLPKIIKGGYHNLGLVHFFTAGEKEVRAWSIRAGIPAPKAAAVIHTDFEKGFIQAEVMTFDDLKEAGSEAETAKAGKKRTEGKAYIVKDGDVCYFKVATIGGKGK